MPLVTTMPGEVWFVGERAVDSIGERYPLLERKRAAGHIRELLELGPHVFFDARDRCDQLFGSQPSAASIRNCPACGDRRTRGEATFGQMEEAACGGETANPEPTYTVRRVVAATHRAHGRTIADVRRVRERGRASGSVVPPLRRGLAVEGHGRGGPAWCTRELSAPFVGARQAETSILKSRPLIVSWNRCTFTIRRLSGSSQTARCSLASSPRRSSERTIEGASTKCTFSNLSDEPYQKKSRCQNFNNRSTVLPHVFHNPDGYGRPVTLDDPPDEQ